MYANEIFSPSQIVRATTAPGGISETELEQTIGVALLADYNEQLANVAHTMQENLSAKKEMQQEVTGLQMINTRTTIEYRGTNSVEVTEEEAEQLKEQYPGLSITEDNGKYYVSKTSLESVIMGKQQELAGLNTNSEMISLQIQSLVDQRKQAITMLSNLIASRNDSLMTIARNLKN